MGLFYTLGISEILGLQEKHLDFAAGLIRVRQRYYRGNLDVTKNPRRTRDIPMGTMAAALRQRCTGDPERFVFSVMTKYGDSRDDRDINQHFLRPAAKKLGIYWLGFGFHQFRRQAITALGVDPMQAQKIAGQSRPDMTGHYTLDDRQRQERAIRTNQERIEGVIPIRKKAASNGPDRAKRPVMQADQKPPSLAESWWARKNSNLRPLPCQGSVGRHLQALSLKLWHLRETQ
jgi:Phage integrase family